MPPAMGQPINVVEKPSRTPGLARFETNRSFTGMGHERYPSADAIIDDRPVDELARRLFDSGGVTSVHVNGSVVTVALADGWAGEQLLDVIRGLYIHYPAAEATGSAQTAAPAADDGPVASDDPAAGTAAAPTVEDAAEITADSAADTADSAATAEADTDPTDFDTRR
jgi:hypothetical protein